MSTLARDLFVDLNSMDETGLPWSFLDEATDPELIVPGAYVVVGAGSVRAVAQVVEPHLGRRRARSSAVGPAERSHPPVARPRRLVAPGFVRGPIDRHADVNGQGDDGYDRSAYLSVVDQRTVHRCALLVAGNAGAAAVVRVVAVDAVEIDAPQRDPHSGRCLPLECACCADVVDVGSVLIQLSKERPASEIDRSVVASCHSGMYAYVVAAQGNREHHDDEA